MLGAADLDSRFRGNDGDHFRGNDGDHFREDDGDRFRGNGGWEAGMTVV